MIRGLVAALLVALTALPFASAMARTRVHAGVGLGFGTWPYRRWPPRYYFPPPVYVVPRTVWVAPPPPIYFTPMPPPATVTPRQCRVFSGDATNDQTGQPFFGRACLWPDGQWHIVQ